jgi:phosphoserine phosphatase
VTDSSAEPVLCVDLDGTLIAGDTTWISVFLLALRKPWLVPGLPLALMRGRASFKSFLAAHVVPRPESLRWHASVLSFVVAERQRGRRILLATAAHRRIADAVSNHLHLFDDVVATEGGHNLKAEAKLEAIRKYAGSKPFDYIGDTTADLPVLAAARRAYLVAPSRRLLERAQRLTLIERVFDVD